MSNRNKGVFFIIMFGMACMTIGGYAVTSEAVEPYRWVLTSIFGIMFLVMGIEYFKKDR